MNQKQLLQALANMANPEPTNATVLTTYSDIGEPPELCKVFNGGTKAEHIKAYQKAYKFTYGEFQLSTIEELSALLTELENHPRSCVIRGKPLIDNPEIVTRTLHDIPEKGQRQYFEDQKSRWIHIDIDKVKVP